MSTVHAPLEREAIDFEEVLRQVNIAANKVHNLSSELQKVMQDLESVEMQDGEIVLGPQLRWDTAIETRLSEIVDDYEKRGKRPPGEDVRMARAKAYVREHQPELFIEYMQLLTKAKALRSTIANEKQVISGKQTVLNGLKAIGA